MSIVQNLSGQTWNNYVQQLAKNIRWPQPVQGDSSTQYNQWQNGPIPVPNIEDLEYNQYRLLDTMTNHKNVAQFKLNKTISPTIDEQLTSATTDLKQVLQKKQEEELARIKELKEQKLQKTAAGFNTIGQAADFGRKFFSGQAANDSNLTQGIDQIYGSVSDSLMGFSPVGTIVGGAMKLGAFTGDVLQSMGGGTDQMTTMDQIMDSPLFSWNVGAISGFVGKKTQEFGVNQDTAEQVGGSYEGSMDRILSAAEKANKKYGAFSSSSRRSANRFIDEARRQQSLMTEISNEAQDQRFMLSDLNHLRHNTDINGTDFRYLRSAKNGIKLEDLRRVKSLKYKKGRKIKWVPKFEKANRWEPVIEIPEFQEGGSIKENWEPVISKPNIDEWVPTITGIQKNNKFPQEYIEFINSVKNKAPNLGELEPEGYNMFRYWELNGKPQNWEQAIDRENPMFQLNSGDGLYHANTISWNQETGEGEWMKNKNHNTAWMEKTFYDGYDFEVDEKGNPVFSEDQPLYEGKRPILKKKVGESLKKSEDFRNKYDLIEDSDGWRKYVPKKFKEGGKIKDSETPEIKETTQKNVIPEGALHARKHNMDNAEEWTKKGIPVVDNSETQQAEIECNELVLNLETTKKLEELQKKYEETKDDKLAIEAGELLVQELMFNLDDKTDLLKTIKV